MRRLVAENASAGAQIICGGQRGVDQWAAQAAAHMGVPFHLVLPRAVAAFTTAWSTTDREALTELMGRAATVEVVDLNDELGQLAYDLRNERVVRQADRLVVVWTCIRRGGTFHTICAARAKGLPIEEVRLDARPETLLSGRGV